MFTIVRRQTGQTDSRLVRGFFLVGVVQSLLAAFAAPFLLSSKHTAAGGMIYYLMDFGAVRASGQTFYFLGFPLALNARWMGVFCGLLCGLLLYNSLAQAFSRINTNRLPLLYRLSYPAGLLMIILFAIDCFVGYFDRTVPIGVIFLIGSCVGLALPFYLVPPAAACLSIVRGSIHRFFATRQHLGS